MQLVLEAAAWPALDGALDVARAGERTGGDRRNRDFAQAARRRPTESTPTSCSSSAATRRRPADSSCRFRPRRAPRSSPSSRARGLFVRRIGLVEDGAGVTSSSAESAPVGPACLHSGACTSRPRARSRLRAFELSPTGFRRLAFASVLALWLIVSTGAVVRLTSSGLGCEHWPGCQPGQPFPEKGYHSYIEFGNRMVGGVTIFLTLALGGRRLARPAGCRAGPAGSRSATFAGTLAQAPLGAITVYAHLHPALVIPHLLLSITVLGAAVVVWLEASRRSGAGAGSRSTARPPRRARYRRRLLRADRLRDGRDRRRPALGRQERLPALVAPPGAAPSRRGGRGARLQPDVPDRLPLRPPGDRPAATSSARSGWPLLVLVQMALGDIQYRTHLPWGLVLVHVAVAATVWAWTVALVTLMWRPPAVERVVLRRLAGWRSSTSRAGRRSSGRY